MRLFFALGLPADTALGLSTYREQRFPASGRPVPVANLHITLAFLGDISEHRLERLCADVDALQGPGTFELTLDRAGYWPKPGICWVGPEYWPPGLERLAGQLAAIGTSHGGKRAPRRYTPHVTLYRACELPPAAPLAPPALKATFDHFALYQSQRDTRGVVYSAVEQWAL